FTDNVAVELHGSTYTVIFRGAYAGISIAYITGAATLTTRMSGIDYYGVETLDIDLGQGNDVFNVQGTSAVTNLSTGPGNDRIYVSSDAHVGLTDHPDYLTGSLANLLGTLNIDGGTGSQTLMISDEANGAGDPHALVTKSYADASARDAG